MKKGFTRWAAVVLLVCALLTAGCNGALVVFGVAVGAIGTYYYLEHHKKSATAPQPLVARELARSTYDGTVQATASP